MNRIGMLFDGVAERYGLLTAAENLLSALDRRRVSVTGVFLTRGEAEARLANCCDSVIHLDVGAMPATRELRGQSRGLRGAARLVAHTGRAVRRLAPLVRSQHLDLMHSHYWHTFLIAGAAARLAGAKCVWHLHGGYALRGFNGQMWNTLGTLLADRFLCISQWVMSTLPRMWQTRASVLYNGLPVGMIQRGGFRGEFRRRFAVRADMRLVGAFGGIIDRKGFGDFVDAALCIGASRPNVCFALVGDAIAGNVASQRLAAKLRETIQHSELRDRFIFAGYVPQAWRMMPDFDLVVLPTVPLPGDPTPDFGEGFGLVLAEAMIQGIASIATRCGASSELIDHGRTGWLVPPRRPAELAAAIEHLLDDETLRRRLGAAGAVDAMRRLDSAVMARDAEALYADICHGSRERT